MLSKFYFHGPEERGPKGNIICRRKNTMETEKKKKQVSRYLKRRKWVPACRSALAEHRKMPGVSELKIHIKIF